MMEGIASQLERTVHKLRGEIVTEKKRLDTWQNTLLEAQNALDAVVYDDKMDMVKTERWMKKAEGRFRNLIDVSATFPPSNINTTRFSYRDVELFSSDGLLDLVDEAFETIFRDGRGSPEHLALMESITKEQKSGGWNDNDEDGEEDVDEVMRKEEKRDTTSIGLTLSDLVAAQKKSNQKAG